MARATRNTSSGSSPIRALSASLLGAFLFSGGLNLLYFTPSLFMMQVYDRVLPTKGLATLAALSVVALAAIVMIGLMDAVRGQVMQRAARLFDARMTGIVADAALDGRRTGESPARALDQVRGAIAAQHILPVMDAPWTPLFILAAAMIHPVIGMIVLAGVVLALAPAVLQRAPKQDAGALQLAVQEHEWAQADAIRALGMRGAMAARYERAKLVLADEMPRGTMASVARALRIGLQMAVLGAGAVLAVEKQISPGALIAASILSSRALAPMEQMAQAWRPMLGAFRAMKLLGAARRHVETRATPTRLPNPTGRLQFDNVAVAAAPGGRSLFALARFEVAPGEIVGVVGGSGAGKSSLARAAVGALPAIEGAVRVDGTDITRWDAEWLGRHTGYMPQELALFSGTIAENIARFEEIAGDERSALVIAAARAAGAHDMIARLPDGYDTVLGPGGRGLSLGQMQRVAMARALYREPPLLVLDEPNAHLDGEGEAALMAALKAARARGAACLVIAHRMGVMSLADRVLAVRDGRIEPVAREELFARRVVVGQKA